MQSQPVLYRAGLYMVLVAGPAVAWAGANRAYPAADFEPQVMYLAKHMGSPGKSGTMTTELKPPAAQRGEGSDKPVPAPAQPAPAPAAGEASGSMWVDFLFLGVAIAGLFFAVGPQGREPDAKWGVGLLSALKRLRGGEPSPSPSLGIAPAAAEVSAKPESIPAEVAEAPETYGYSEVVEPPRIYGYAEVVTEAAVSGYGETHPQPEVPSPEEASETGGEPPVSEEEAAPVEMVAAVPDPAPVEVPGPAEPTVPVEASAPAEPALVAAPVETVAPRPRRRARSTKSPSRK